MMYYQNGYYVLANHTLTIQGDENNVMHYVTDNRQYRTAKLYYKHPTGWNCYRFGLWFFAVFDDGTKKKVYLQDLVEYR